MSKSNLFFAAIVIAGAGYFGFPYFQEYYLFNKAWNEPTETAVDEYLDAFSENERGEELMARADRQLIKELLEHCDTNTPFDTVSVEGDCCLHLHWYLKRGRSMFESSRFRAALDSCVFYANADRSNYERVKAYYQTVGKGDFSREIDRLAESLPIGERLSAIRPPLEEASKPQELVTYLKGKRFSEPIPIFYDQSFEWPKAYTDYDPLARQLLEEAYLGNADYYTNGRQPEAADFEQVNNPIWSFIVKEKGKDELAERLANHLQKYVGDGRITFEEPAGPPLVRPRVELSYKLQNREDTIAGMVVPILGIGSSSQYSSGAGLKESFTGYSLTSELRMSLKYYPEDPKVAPFIYHGRGSADDEVRVVGGNNSIDLRQASNKSTLENTMNNIVSQIYLEVPIEY